MKKNVFSILILAVILLTLCGCTYSKGNYIFGTYYSIEIEGKNSNKDGKEIDALLIDVEKHLSTNLSTSDIYRLNNAKANEAITVSHYTVELFKFSKELYIKSNHAFNIASYPLTELWCFSPDKYIGAANSIPSSEDINSLLSLCDLELFTLDEINSTITKLRDDAKLDFGAIAKGYAADLCYQKVSGEKAVLDIGRTFKVKGLIDLYVVHPRGGDFVAKATIKNKAVATSGDYERYYIVDGIRYHHIIGTNGYPSGISEESPIISATIVGESATVCDALSTTCMVLGYPSSENLVKEYNCSALLLTENGYYTIGENIFEIQDTALQKLN